jgi:hypothetical protein
VLKNTSFSSLRTDSSKNLTFSQSQSHATVPLRDLIEIQHVIDIESQEMSMLITHVIQQGVTSLCLASGQTLTRTFCYSHPMKTIFRLSFPLFIFLDVTGLAEPV